MGAVYAAHDPELERTVALKVLHVGPSRDEGALRTRLKREAQALARLSHPNVVSVYDVGTWRQGVFIAMELVEGATLRAWLQRPHDWRTIVDVFVSAGRGLEAAHRAGLVHRDFKPDNVLIGAEADSGHAGLDTGRVRVTDFGLARIAGLQESAAGQTDGPLDLSITRTGTLLGTPAYMSPEQMFGRATDARTDIFSFCVSLYEALYGERPFAGENLASLRAAIVAQRVREPPRGRKVPGWLRRVLLRGLSATPDARVASMPALLAALTRDRQRWMPRAVGIVAVLVLLTTTSFGLRRLLDRNLRGAKPSAATQLTAGAPAPSHDDEPDGPGVVSLGTPLVRGSLARDVVEATVRAHVADVKKCYQWGLRRDAKLRGDVTIQYTIEASGEVMVSVIQSSSLPDRFWPVGTCIASAPRRWKFPKPPDGKFVIVSYPFTVESRAR
jgi:serine/threonine protein kinase